MEAIKVLLAEDHHLVRQGINSLLSPLSHITIVGEAENGHEAFELAKRHNPDVVLMDVGMKSLRGIEAAEKILRDYPKVRIVMLTSHDNEQYIRRSVKIGASGYLVKDTVATELIAAIEHVMEQNEFICSCLSDKALQKLLKEVKEKKIQNPLDRLTPRQREVLQLIAEGKTNQDIGTILSISHRTVDSHRTELMKRLDIHDTAGLTRFAIQHGLVDPKV